MRHLRDPENICAGLLIVAFFLPWISVLGASVAGYQFTELGKGGLLAWIIPAAALGVIVARVSGVRSTALSVIVGLLPLAWFLLLLAEEGVGLGSLQMGAWLSVLAGLGLVAAAAARRAQQPATTGAEGTNVSGAAGEEVEDRA